MKCPVCNALPLKSRERICGKCKTVFDDGEKYRVLMAKKPPGTEQLGIFRDNMYHWTFLGSRAGSLLSKAFDAVVRACCKKIRENATIYNHKYQLFPCSWVVSEEGTFAKGVPDKLRMLHAAIQEAIDEAYSAGKQEGHDFIKGLASGEVSMKQFNDETIDGGDRD